MRITTAKAVKALRFSTKATLADLSKYTGTKPNELYIEAQKLGYAAMEPQIWQYTGADGKSETEFTLDILMPIQGEGNGTKPETFEIVDVPEFKALQTLHEGPWSELGPVYCQLMRHVSENKLAITGVTREVYVRCDFENQENCITEVMIGLA